MPDTFLTRHLRQWVSAACVANGWPEPGDDYYAKIAERIPPGVRQLIASGIDSGLITTDGYVFKLPRQAPGKGPYRWLSDRLWAGGPHPNWEYLLQVAEYVRLSRIVQVHGLRLTFEDELMDMALYQDHVLLVCVEAKERQDQLHSLLQELNKHATNVDLAAPDRHLDGLRKAKYIVRRRPRYFCGVAVGIRLEYRVEWLSDTGFRLVPDVIPYL